MTEDYYHWPFAQLVRYILKQQHLRLNHRLTAVQDDFRRLSAKSGRPSPLLCEIQQTFSCFAGDVKRHLSKEAIVVFPFLTRYAKELKKTRKHRRAGLHSVCFPVDKMYREHKKEMPYFNLLLQQMKTESLAERDDALYAAICTGLSEFKKLWEAQVSFENNIVFPGLIEMEAALTSN